jgi:hypothetical protein
MARDYTREEQLDVLADITAMLTLALDDDRDELERYVASLACDDERVSQVLQGVVVLYGEAFSRLGGEQGFHPQTVTRRIALAESCERWGVRAEG